MHSYFHLLLPPLTPVPAPIAAANTLFCSLLLFSPSALLSLACFVFIAANHRCFSPASAAARAT